LKPPKKARNEYRSAIYDAKVKIALARWRSGSVQTENRIETEIRKGQC
jgi:hypothetical protein